MSKNIILYSYSLNRSDKRGVYQYTRSLLNSLVSTDFDLSLITQLYDVDSLDVLSEYMSNPNKYFSEFGGDTKVLLKYLENLFGEDVYTCFSLYNNIRDFEALSNIINNPIIYYRNNINLLLPFDRFVKSIDIPFLNGSDIIFTDMPLAIKSNRHKIVQTVHDIIPIQEKRKFYQYFYKRLKSTTYANKILCVSEYTRQQYLNYFPRMEDRTEVVYQPLPANDEAIQLSALPEIQQQVLNKFKLKPKQYMYYVGAIEHRKNIHTLIKAYGLATGHDKSLPLVISGSVDHKYIKEHKLCEHFEGFENYEPSSSNIMKTDFVSDVEKLVLLRNCRAFLFPTLSEGFGIPVIEAQTVGVPVLTSNNTSLPEVTNGSALLLDDPLDVDEMQISIQKLWSDDLLVSNLTQKGLTNSLRFTKQKFSENLCVFLKNV